MFKNRLERISRKKKTMRKIPVSFVNKTVVKYSIDFMNPKSMQLFLFFHNRRRREKNTANHTRKVSQVEQIMTFAWRRQKILNGLFIDFHCSLNDYFSCAHKRRIEALAKMPITYSREDFDHRVVAERVHCNHV